MNPTSLSEYIERKQAKPVELRKTPAWIRRMQEKGLPNKDQTSYIVGSFVPRGSGGAA